MTSASLLRVAASSLLLTATLATGCVVGEVEIAEQQFDGVLARSQMTDPAPDSVCPEGPCIATQLIDTATGELVASIVWDVDTATGEMSDAGRVSQIAVSERRGLIPSEANQFAHDSWAAMRDEDASSTVAPTSDDQTYGGTSCRTEDLQRTSMCCYCFTTVCVTCLAGDLGCYVTVVPTCRATGDCTSGYSRCSPYTSA